MKSMADYKDAEAIKAQIREVCRDCWNIQRVGGCVMHCGINEAIKAVDAVPAADAVPVVHGQWKAVTDDGEVYKRICSCCGKEAPYNEIEEVYLLYPHCPWCGASMGV